MSVVAVAAADVIATARNAVQAKPAAACMRQQHAVSTQKNLSVVVVVAYTIRLITNYRQEGLAVASIVRDDPSLLPGMHCDSQCGRMHFECMRAHCGLRAQCVVN